LINEAGFQLRTAHFGLDLYSRVLNRDIDTNDLGETKQFIVYGCESMIRRSLVSCLDLCAASVCHVSRLHPVSSKAPHHQASVSDFERNRKLRRAMREGAIAEPLAKWLERTQASLAWKLLSEWRNSATHS